MENGKVSKNLLFNIVRDLNFKLNFGGVIQECVTVVHVV